LFFVSLRALCVFVVKKTVHRSSFIVFPLIPLPIFLYHGTLHPYNLTEPFSRFFPVLSNEPEWTNNAT
ncbi:MAG TPA: hypothetical protein VM186_13325, partial [Planctomycetota bacterium]|nr:hypothetical protein [Planctomycetota bacterium]